MRNLMKNISITTLLVVFVGLAALAIWGAAQGQGSELHAQDLHTVYLGRKILVISFLGMIPVALGIAYFIRKK